MQDRVAAQFGGHADHVVPGWAVGQACCQPPAHQADLALLAAEHLPPSARTCRNQQRDRGIPTRLITGIVRVADVSIASHGQASSVMQMAGDHYSVRMASRTCGHVQVICPGTGRPCGGGAARAVRSAAFLLSQSISARLSAEPVPAVNCGNIGEAP